MHKFTLGLIALTTITGANSLFAQDKPNTVRNLAERRIEVIRKFDKDGDGKLNAEEQDAAQAAFRKKSEDEAQKNHLRQGDVRRKLLEWYDRDGDGKLNAAEQQTAQAEFGSLLASMSEREEQPQAERRPDADTAQASPRGRAEQARRQMIAAFDKDGDGELSESEQAAMREDFEKKRQAGRLRLLKEFDKNGDGEIDGTERDAMRASLGKRREELIKKYDKDGNGELGEEEREAMFNDFIKQRDEITKKYDKNGNGYLEFEEEEKAHADGAFEGINVGPGFIGPGNNLSPERGRSAPPQSRNEQRPPRPTDN